jgi:hypothetical protein
LRLRGAYLSDRGDRPDASNTAQIVSLYSASGIGTGPEDNAYDHCEPQPLPTLLKLPRASPRFCLYSIRAGSESGGGRCSVGDRTAAADQQDTWSWSYAVLLCPEVNIWLGQVGDSGGNSAKHRGCYHVRRKGIVRHSNSFFRPCPLHLYTSLSYLSLPPPPSRAPPIRRRSNPCPPPHATCS